MEENKINDNYLNDINKYLYFKKNKIKFINRGIMYSLNDIYKLRKIINQYSKMYVNDILEMAKDNDKLFMSESMCNICNNINKYEFLNKESFVNFLYEGLTCSSCKRNIIEEKKIQDLLKNEKYTYEMQQRKSENTLLFIDKYINNNHNCNYYKRPSKEYYSMKSLHNNSNEDSLIKTIKNLKYNEFLKTYYWNIISAYVKYRSEYKCELCYNNNNLHVHHKTYINHGFEILNISDLIVLCSKCHNHHHHKLHKEEL